VDCVLEGNAWIATFSNGTVARELLVDIDDNQRRLAMPWRVNGYGTAMPRFKGYTVHASADEPQYEIKSDKTDHIAMHKGSALRRLRG
jgi:hypothetical protein